MAALVGPLDRLLYNIILSIFLNKQLTVYTEFSVRNLCQSQLQWKGLVVTVMDGLSTY